MINLKMNMGKDNMEILVVPKNKLFGKNKDDYFQGFKPSGQVDYEQRILDHSIFMRRGDAEINPEFKQSISYCLIVNPQSKKIFSYQRADDDSKYPERRLHGRWSIGVGGHVEKSDSENPIFESLRREISEEVEPFHVLGKPEVLGYVNYDENEVSKVHFGLLYLVETDTQEIREKDPEITNGKLRHIDELEQILFNPDLRVEEWSKIAFKEIKKILN